MTLNKTRPQYFPLHAELGGDTVAPEDSLYIQASYVDGLPVPSGDHNGKLNSNGKWVSYNDATLLRVQDWLDTTNAQALTLTRLTYANGGNITTTGAVVATRGVYLLAGGRLETDDAFLNPVGGNVVASPLVVALPTLPGRVWLYVSADGVLRVESVGPAVADAPAGNELTLNGLQVDGLGVVTDGALVPSYVPPYRVDIVVPLYTSGALEIDGVDTMLTVTGGQTEGGFAAAVIDGGVGPSLQVKSISPTDYAGSMRNAGGGPALFVDADSAAGALVVSAATGVGVVCTATGASDAVTVTASNNGAGVNVTHTGAGSGIVSDATGGSGYAVEAYGPSFGTSIYAATSTGSAVQGVAATSGVGLRGTGGASAASLAVRGEATHDDAYAIQGLTSATATTSAAGVLGTGRGAGAGVVGNATGTGHGVVAQADTTSPSRAALLLVAQDADPTTNTRGSLLHNSSRGATGKLRTYTTQWESVHSTAKGYVFDFGVPATGSTGGGSGNLSISQISTEQIGVVLVTGTGSLAFSLDTGACTVALWDVTGVPVLIATQIERAIDTDGVAPNTRSFVIRGTRTLAGTSAQSFAVIITATTGSIDYAHVITSVQGVQ